MPWALQRNQSESRMPEIGTSGLMSGEGKRGDAGRPKSPRPSSTLPIRYVLTFTQRPERTFRW